MPGGDRALAYWRWHGSPRMYYSAYDDERLREQARAVSAVARAARQTWVVFDNTAHGHATDDALRFAAMMALADPQSAARGKARACGPNSALSGRRNAVAGDR
jgi:uncharacterized protein YecE (DUF72 family)